MSALIQGIDFHVKEKAVDEFRAGQVGRCEPGLRCAGAVEAVFAVLALAEGVAPPTRNLLAPEPDLLPGLVRWHGPPAALRPGPCAVVSTSFGFGGVNAALAFAMPPLVPDEGAIDGLP